MNDDNTSEERMYFLMNFSIPEEGQIDKKDLFEAMEMSNDSRGLCEVYDFFIEPLVDEVNRFRLKEGK